MKEGYKWSVLQGVHYELQRAAPRKGEEERKKKAQQIELKWKWLPRSCLTSYPQVGVLKIVPP